MTTNPLHTFSGESRSTAPVSGNDNQILSAGQLDRRAISSSRPLETNYITRRDLFIRGSASDGDIGEWGWDASRPAGASLSYGQGIIPSGRSLGITTGPTAGNEVFLHKALYMSGAEIRSALTFFINVPLVSNPASPLHEGRVKCGWSDQFVPDNGGLFLVGWDSTVGPNFLLWMRGSDSTEIRTIDTGVAIPTNATHWTPRFRFDLIGREANAFLGGSWDNIRVIISGNTSGYIFHPLLDAEYPTGITVFNCRLIAALKTYSATAKWLSVEGVEMAHDQRFF